MGHPELNAVGVDSSQEIEEPPHSMEPIPPVLGENIRTFPPGFSRSALAGDISPYMVHYLGRLFK